jgi:histidinol-phosphate aminotransferase
MNDKVIQFVRPEIRALTAYHVPDAANMIKLDAMENPYSWPQPVVELWLERLYKVHLNRYPEPAPEALKARLRSAMSIPAPAALLLGNGSDELIQMIMLAVSGPDRVVLSVEPGFAMYRLIAAATGMRYVGTPLLSDFSLDLPATLAAIAHHQPAVIFLAYPNNPTGNLFDDEALHTIIQAAPGLVVIDEAYHVFAEKSFMGALAGYPHLLILRTLSKMGLAGLRLGLLIGAPAWLNEIDKLRLPYNINALTQISALFALEQQAMLDAQAQQICQDRAQLSQALAGCPGLTVYPSAANFILFRTPEGQATPLFEKLKAAGVLIKNMQGASGLPQDFLRVTVGTPRENQVFLTALRNAL